MKSRTVRTIDVIWLERKQSYWLSCMACQRLTQWKQLLQTGHYHLELLDLHQLVVGYEADIIALSESPLANISALAEPDKVNQALYFAARLSALPHTYEGHLSNKRSHI